MFDKKAWTNNYRKELNSKGLCRDCRKPLGTSITRCDRCHSRHKERTYAIRDARSESGMCRSCGKLPISGKSSNCLICVLKDASRTCFGLIKHWKELEQLFEDQKGVCPYTNIKIELGKNAALDHIVPKSKGGTNDIDNLQWVHLWINKMKNDTPDDEFQVELKEFTESCKHLLFD